MITMSLHLALKLGSVSSDSIVKIVLAILGLLHFHINFGIISISKRKNPNILIWITLNL